MKVVSTSRRRGRKPGSKNKPKVTPVATHHHNANPEVVVHGAPRPILDFIPTDHKYGIVTNVLLTPARAQQWLETVKRNRDINSIAVARYASEIKNGEWRYHNGATMSFDWNGEFRDGQHRCWAVVEAGIAVRVDVAYNLDPDSIRTVDIGLARSYGDTITMEERGAAGEKVRVPNASNIGRALSFILAHESGNVYERCRPYPTNDQIYKAFSERKTELMKSVKTVGKRFPLCSMGICIALHYIFTRVEAHRVLADEFFRMFMTGENIPPGNAVGALRNRLISIKQDGRAAVNTRFTLAYIIKAWEAFKRNKDIKVLVVAGEERPEITRRTDR